MDQKVLANAIRFLSMDAVQKANSGHPGMPMGMADIAEVLWRHHFRHNPSNPNWSNRDRFVLSNGHGSMLLYSLLHLTGYDLTIEDLKNFRQLHSKTPGHPEYGYAPGVETTTGPLGQGVANAVGMALAEKILAKSFNRDGYNLVDHHTYVFLGDGCLMEGVSHEACSLAGTLGLGKLIAFWDDNHISIDGKTSGWFTENVAERYKAYGWQVIENIDGHDADQINQAILDAKADTDRPALICCRTSIGYGAPNKADSASAHGSPLGDEEIQNTRKALGWKYPAFEIPSEIYTEWDARDCGVSLEAEWNKLFDQYSKVHSDSAHEFTRRVSGELPAQWSETLAEVLQTLVAEKPKVATRKASQMALDHICAILPEMFGGSADLTGSNLTNWSGSKWLNYEQDGDYLSYGVREFGMAAIMNGIALHGGLKPFGGTFLVFTDYARNAIRMSALMKLPVAYVMTHDSIGLGEDGPTHQPIEHLSSLRLIPNLNVWRPADTFETQVAWQAACEEKNAPSVLALSRQGLPALVDHADYAERVKQGGYALKRQDDAEVVLVATGSEVELIVNAAKALEADGIHAQVVSMPCVEKFKQQTEEYQSDVLLKHKPIIFVEAGSTALWYQFMQGRTGTVIGLDHFGESAPADQLYKEFGLTVENIVKHAKSLVCK